jgi:hypothetical protein
MTLNDTVAKSARMIDCDVLWLVPPYTTLPAREIAKSIMIKALFTLRCVPWLLVDAFDNL